ncbi:hypothetical protein BJX65DRAFT_301271 [Aspergillus insuetus]
MRANLLNAFFRIFARSDVIRGVETAIKGYEEGQALDPWNPSHWKVSEVAGQRSRIECKIMRRQTVFTAILDLDKLSVDQHNGLAPLRPIAALSLLLFLLSLAQPSLAFWPLTARHEDHDHNSTDDQGVGHGHSMSHGSFNFKPSRIPWPTCPRECCNQFFEFFPAPVTHPLCVSEEFYHNVTACIAETYTPYEQGAYAVVAEIECLEDDSYAGEEVRALLEGSEESRRFARGWRIVQLFVRMRLRLQWGMRRQRRR